MQNTWSEVELAYFAGILDGEGCLSLNMIKPGARNARTSGNARVQIVNTDARLIHWLHTHFGGAVYPAKRYRSHHKPAWQWALSGAEIDQLLPLVVPYLVVKREQAELILEFRRTIQKGNNQHRRLTDEVLARRAELKDRLTILNGKGVAS